MIANILSLATRYLWVEIKGRLIEVEATKRVRIDGQDLNVPLSHLERTAEKLAELNSATRASAQAAKGKAERDFAANTGKAWHAGVRKSGRPKHATGTAAHEGRVAKGMKPPRKAA